MKKLIALLTAVILISAMASCGAAGKTIKTVSILDYCEVETLYTFTSDGGKLVSVEQRALYQDEANLEFDYSILSGQDGYFTDLRKSDDMIFCTLTDEGLSHFYPGATFESILETAKAGDLEIETK